MKTLKPKDEVIIQDGTDQYRATITRVNLEVKEILLERKYSPEVTTTLWVSISKVIKHKSNS